MRVGNHHKPLFAIESHGSQILLINLQQQLAVAASSLRHQLLRNALTIKGGIDKKRPDKLLIDNADKPRYLFSARRTGNPGNGLR